MQIKLNSPHTNSNSAFSASSWLQTLNPQEQEQALFHLKYNPVMECSYALPAYSWLTSSMSEQADQHYIGDKTLILSFSYVQPPPPPPPPTPFPSGGSTGTPDDQLRHLASAPLSTLLPPASSTTSLSAPQIKIHWLRVTLEWIISFTQPKIHCTQIYADQYAQLRQTLANQYGYYKYDDLSEPVLAYIIHRNDNNDKHKQQQTSTLSAAAATTTSWTMQGDEDDSVFSPVMVDGPPTTPIDDDPATLPKQLLSYVQEHTHEYRTRLSRLEHMLEGACVNPRMLWKYPFAKSFVVGNGSLLCEEDVVRRIQDAEVEWRLLSRGLKRRPGAL